LNCLHYAARNGNLEICLLLITRGCDSNIRDDFGNNASYWAKKYNKIDILQFLPPPMMVSALENKEFRDDVDLHRYGLTAEDKKKMNKGKGGKKKK
jgi:hypothetical protein